MAPRMRESLKTFRRRLLNWYDRHRRDLPWRPPRTDAPVPASVDPYLVLVSELMLQQTQVETVIPYFRRFIERFPTLADLALADEQEVLRLWQGLGYYARARNLQQATQKVMADFDGRLPPDIKSLRTLPGVGRYTAGAISSIAFGRRAPILDGNVIRVLCRLDRIEGDPRDPATQEVLWARAEEVLPRARVGDFNSALMELGAVVCSPRAPRCLLCPARGNCDAFIAGVQEKLPPPKKARPTPLRKRWVFCIRRQTPAGEEWLIEQRPANGRWAAMWQFVTIEATTTPPNDQSLSGRLPLKISAPTAVGVVTHALTHRRYQFEVFQCNASEELPLSDHPRRWTALADLGRYPLPRPHLKVARILQNTPTARASRGR